mmetsp:Transcript_109269/g.308288  ORF Transcript_109269/g.308288 Transcript_109269/m.308288 type:complete len:589 (+) Transcript_109269:136-1902(+)
MGRSRSREKKKDKDREKKDKDRKRSRSRDRREKEKRSRSRDRKKDKEREEPPPPEPRKRSPSFQMRRWRFDSPPKEEEYQRDAMLTGNPMGMGGVAAALQGGLALAGASNTVSPLTLAADTRAMRELYVGNLPAGITSQQLVQFLNQVGQAVKVNSLPGEPVLTATLGGGGLFAFVEFRTAEEAANGLRLNGVELLGSQLKIGRPKGYAGPDSAGGLALPGIAQPGAGLQTGGGGMLALTGGAPSLGDMMAQHGGANRPGMLALPGAAGGVAVSAIDHRLCLVNIPTFVGEERIKELLLTFGQLKFFALQKDEGGKSVGVAFFEYQDMMTQQQARAALEGLELGAKRLSVKRPEEVIEMGLVAREQRLGARVVPSKILYLKGVVTREELAAGDAQYQELCTDIRLEAEKFGPVVSMEVPRPGEGGGSGGPGGGAPGNALTAGSGGALALTMGEDTVPKAKAAPPVVPDLSMAIVPAGQKMPMPVVPPPGSGYANRPGAAGADGDVPGVGYAFIEFATIEGSSKAKKALNGRRFGENLVEAEYFSEQKYLARDFARPLPNTDEPIKEPGSELVLFGQAGTLDEAPVMAD